MFGRRKRLQSETSPTEAHHSPYRSDATPRIDEDGSDPFGHSDYADAIEAALDEVPSQFTLGLFGPWGSGKSTILGELSRRLNSPKKPGTALAVFDAWRYGGDSLRREFVREVGEQLKRHSALPKRFKVARHVESFAIDITRPRDRLPALSWVTIASAVLSALFVIVVIAGLYGLYALVDLDNETTVKAEIAVLGPIVAFVLIIAGRLTTPVQVQESRRRFEFPEQFAKNFQGLLDKVKVEKVVIAIDNLDRCAPQRVADVLSTIKTFLEPALEERENPGAKSLCFIIVADDDALRRHLIAQEIEQIVPVAGLSSADEADDPARVAREAVDEYLRKFFNAGIRITEMLDDDMRAFTERELGDFFTAHKEIKPSVRRRLVELTAQGLKRNPRRLKQFVNNLELRLQLFADRRAADHILIEADIVVVAKLAILEEEFPERYLKLRREPSLLAAWHAEAEKQNPDGMSEELIGFLRFTDNIMPPDIVPYLTLKQTRDELELPGYRDFVDQLDEANSKVLAEMMADGDPRLTERRLNAARTHFDRLISGHAWDRAHGAARAVLETPALHGTGDELAAHVIDRALSNREVRPTDLDPQLLLGVGLRALGSRRFAELIDAEVEVISGPAARPESRNLICEAFATIAADLDSIAKQHLRRAFTDPHLRQSFAAYADLALVMPEIVSDKTVQDALTELEGLGIFDAELPGFLVATANPGLLGRNPDLANRLIKLTRASLNQYRVSPDEDRYVDLAEALSPVIAAANDDEELSALAGEVQEGWDKTPEEVRMDSLELGLRACRASEAADSNFGAALGARLFEFENAETVGEWIVENAPELPPNFEAGLRQRLKAGLVGGGEDIPRYADYVSKLTPSEQDVLFNEAAREATELGRFGATEELMQWLGDAEADSIVVNAAERIEANPDAALDGEPGLINFVVEYQEKLQAAQIDRIATVLIAGLVQRRGRAPTLGPLIGRLQVPSAERRLEHVKTLIAFDQEVSNLERREGILRAAFLIAGRRPSNALNAITEWLASVSDGSPAQAEMVRRVEAG